MQNCKLLKLVCYVIIMKLTLAKIEAQTPTPFDQITYDFYKEIAWFPDAISKSSKLPDQLALPITIADTEVTILATKRTNRSQNFEVLLQQEDGSFKQMNPGPVNTYQGYIEEYPNYKIGAVITQNGVFVDILTPSNKVIEIAPNGNKKYYIQLSKSNTHKQQLDCNVIQVKEEKEDFSSFQKSTLTSKNRGRETVKQAELGFDIAWTAYNARYGRNTNDVRSNIDQFINMMNTIWIRDVMVEHVIGKVIIRTSAASCPYERAGNRNVSNASLNQVKDIWNSGAHGNTHDLATLHVGGGGGGLAWVGKVNESLKYSVTDGGSKHAWRGFNRHEIGHTWGLRHGHGRPELKPNGQAFGIMRGGPHDRATSDEAKTMIDERNSSNLKDIGPYRTSNIRPYGNRDWVTVRKGSNITIDVLANDYDANRDAISIATFDTNGKNGGVIRRGNGNTLVYTASGGIGEDRFYYTVTDGKLNNWGVVHVNVTPENNCSWSNRPGKGFDIGAGSNKVFVVGTDRTIYRWNNSSWARMPGVSTKSVDVAYGSPYVIATNNNIYRNLNNNQWEKIPGQGLDIGGGTNALCIIGTNSRIYKYAGGGNWSVIRGITGKRIDVTNQGAPWIVGMDNHVYQHLGGEQWGKKGNFKASDLTISGDGTVWGIQLNSGFPFKYKGNGVWERFLGILTHITAQSNGSLWGTNRNKSIFENTCVNNRVSEQDFSINKISDGSKTVVSIYPNPASDKIFIEASHMDKQKVSAQIIDVKGRVLKTESTSYHQGIQMDVSAITKGLYILRITVQGKQAITKSILIK